MNTIDLFELKRQIKYYDHPVDSALLLKVLDYFDYAIKEANDDGYAMAVEESESTINNLRDEIDNLEMKYKS